jgi:hypothetical protein
MLAWSISGLSINKYMEFFVDLNLDLGLDFDLDSGV